LAGTRTRRLLAVSVAFETRAATSTVIGTSVWFWTTIGS